MNERREATTLIATTRAPRPWATMLVTWMKRLLALVAIVGPPPEAIEVPKQSHPGAADLHLRVWRWMWSLPPFSEVRKAAFTIGAAALMIDRWRGVEDIGEALAPLPEDAAIGQRAEGCLRICRWHIDDAMIEASNPTRRPGIPPHVRIYAYSQPVDPERGGVNFCGVMNNSDRRRVTLAMLDDFVRHASERKTLKPSDDALIALAPALVETLGASLPEGPWIVTSQDVWRFLAELLLEDG